MKELTTQFEIAMFWINAAERHGIKTSVSLNKLQASKKLEDNSITETFNLNLS